LRDSALPGIPRPSHTAELHAGAPPEIDTTDLAVHRIGRE